MSFQIYGKLRMHVFSFLEFSMAGGIQYLHVYTYQWDLGWLIMDIQNGIFRGIINLSIIKGPFRIYDLRGGGFDPNGRSKTSMPPKNIGRILVPPLKTLTGFWCPP